MLVRCVSSWKNMARTLGGFDREERKGKLPMSDGHV